MLFWDFKFSGLFWAFENFQATEQAAIKRGLGTVGAASGFQQAVAVGSEASLPAVPPAERAACSGMTGRKAFALALSRGAEAFMPGRRGGVRKSPDARLLKPRSASEPWQCWMTRPGRSDSGGQRSEKKPLAAGAQSRETQSSSPGSRVFQDQDNGRNLMKGGAPSSLRIWALSFRL